MSELHALLVAGSEPLFIERTQFFKHYLTDAVGVKNSNIGLLYGPTSRGEVLRAFNFLAEKPDSAPACIFYLGHGVKDALKPGNYKVPYEQIAGTIRQDNPFIFINISCNSGSCIPVFREAGLLENGLVVASSRADEDSYDDIFFSLLLGHYSSNLQLNIGRITAKSKSEKEFIVSYTSAQNRTIKMKMSDPFDANRKLSDDCDIVPVTKVTMQHPIKRGRQLEHLLFSRQR